MRSATKYSGARRSLDMILTALEAGRPTHDPLTANV